MKSWGDRKRVTFAILAAIAVWATFTNLDRILEPAPSEFDSVEAAAEEFVEDLVDTRVASSRQLISSNPACDDGTSRVKWGGGWSIDPGASSDPAGDVAEFSVAGDSGAEPKVTRSPAADTVNVVVGDVRYQFVHWRLEAGDTWVINAESTFCIDA